jgi:hypothetical protein
VAAVTTAFCVRAFPSQRCGNDSARLLAYANEHVTTDKAPLSSSFIASSSSDAVSGSPRSSHRLPSSTISRSPLLSVSAALNALRATTSCCFSGEGFPLHLLTHQLTHSSTWRAPLPSVSSYIVVRKGPHESTSA